jgi:hypothetical protein
MNKEIALQIYRKIRSRDLFKEDLKPFLEALQYFTNQSEYAEDEIYGWEKVVQVNLSDAENFYVKTEKPLSEHPELIIEYGDAESPDTTINTDGDTFTGFICGRVRSPRVPPRVFEVKGDNTQSMIFFILLMLIGQEFWEQERQAKEKS